MLSFPFIGLLFAASCVRATDDVVRLADYDLASHPDKIGQLHNVAFAKLSQKYTTRMPNNKDEIMIDMKNILYDFCYDQSPDCRSYADKAITMGIEDNRDGPATPQYPRFMDTKLKTSLDKIITAVNTLGEDNVDSVIETITEIQLEIDQMQSVNYFHKWIAISAASVAAHSTRLWSEVFHDQSHPLHLLLVEKSVAGRELLDPEWDWLDDGVEECEMIMGAGVGSAVVADISGIFSALVTTVIRTFLIGALAAFPPLAPVVVVMEFINALGIAVWAPFVAISYSSVAAFWGGVAYYACTQANNTSTDSPTPSP